MHYYECLNSSLMDCVTISSNLGSYHLQGVSTDLIDNSVKEAVMSDVKRHFRPEFLNRLDDIIIFAPLGQRRKLPRLCLRFNPTNMVRITNTYLLVFRRAQDRKIATESDKRAPSR